MGDAFLGLSAVLLFTIIHIYSDKHGWYQKYKWVDTVTHFLGGVALGYFVKELMFGLALIFLWELLEALLVKEGRAKFRETPMNKIKDILAGLLGFLVGAEFL